MSAPDEVRPVGSRSAGCSPAPRRKLRFLSCVESDDGPFEGEYFGSQDQAPNDFLEPQQMSPRARLNRIRRMMAILSPARRRKRLPMLSPSAEVNVSTRNEPLLHIHHLQIQDGSGREVRHDYVALLVKIRLKEGKNLAVRDASGSSDPYVKFKLQDRVIYKSSTIFKSLNPSWDEEFQIIVDDVTAPMTIEVFDYDRFCSDDFMGSSSVDISSIKWFTPSDINCHLHDESNPEEPLGNISLSVNIIPQTQQEKEAFLQKATRGVLSEAQMRKEKTMQMWHSVVNIVLVEGKNLVVNNNTTAVPDPFCKFKLGCEKYKSKVCNRTNEPQWLEQFDLHLYEDGCEVLEILCHDKRSNTPIGKATLELATLARDATEQHWLRLDNGGQILMVISVSGTMSTESVVDLTEQTHNDVRNAVVDKYYWTRTLEDFKDVGELSVKVFCAEELLAKDIGGTSDPFAVLELVNSRLQTHTEYRTLSPHWNKLFTFGVRDIHSILEITIYDEDPNNKSEFLGKIAIPLMSIKNGERRWFALKDKKLQEQVKGRVLLELDVIWNPIRAALRTFKPREKKYIQREQKFKAGLFRATVMELKEVCMEIVEYQRFVQSCFDWHSTTRSLTAFSVFMLATIYMELYHLPMILLLLFGRSFLIRKMSVRSSSSSNHLTPMDSEDKITNSSQTTTSTKKHGTSIRDTLSSVQDSLTTAQTALVAIAALIQRIRNTFNFTNPWLSFLAIIVLSVATTLLYLVPIRWILMIWGVNKFTKKLRNPHLVDNNELLDFLSRVPCDAELKMWRDIPVEVATEGRSRRGR